MTVVRRMREAEIVDSLAEAIKDPRGHARYETIRESTIEAFGYDAFVDYQREAWTKIGIR